jgi:hypothetical protein
MERGPYHGDGINWTLRPVATDLVGSRGWAALTHGNGLFVAVANVGTLLLSDNVMTSPDGITWTSQSSGFSDYRWKDATYANGQFVAVARGFAYYNKVAAVMTSPDGITWTLRNVPNRVWTSITYGAGLFVVVGYGGVVMTSPDGATWTERSSGNSLYWLDLIYANGQFVAVSGGVVMTSPDGITWTTTSPHGFAGQAITYGLGLYAVVIQGGNTNTQVMTSPDGITWTPRITGTSPSDWNLYRTITYGNGYFVALDWSQQAILTSPDGITWTKTGSTNGSYWIKVIYADGRFVALAQGQSAYIIMTSR